MNQAAFLLTSIDASPGWHFFRVDWSSSEMPILRRSAVKVLSSLSGSQLRAANRLLTATPRHDGNIWPLAWSMGMPAGALRDLIVLLRTGVDHEYALLSRHAREDSTRQLAFGDSQVGARARVFSFGAVDRSTIAAMSSAEDDQTDSRLAQLGTAVQQLVLERPTTAELLCLRVTLVDEPLAANAARSQEPGLHSDLPPLTRAEVAEALHRLRAR